MTRAITNSWSTSPRCWAPDHDRRQATTYTHVARSAGTVTDLARLAKTRLKKMQYTGGLIDGFFQAAGLSPP